MSAPFSPTPPPGPAAPGSGDSADPRVRWAFLAKASQCLADSLDYETTLETVAGLALPLLGSWSIVDLTEPDGTIRRLAIVHPDPERQRVARELKVGWPPRREDPMGLPVVARTGRSELVSHISDDFLVQVAHTEENLPRLRELGMTSLLTVPMRARGKIVGAITFIASDDSRPFRASDVSLAEDLAERCAVAIENARLYRAARVLTDAERARLRADAADQVKTEFLATASHELRTPLNIMAGYLELLAMEIAGPLTAEQHRYVERIRAGDQQLMRIVEDMLNLARLHAQEIEYEIADVALNVVIEGVAEAYRTGLEAKGLVFVVRCEGAIRAHTDPAKVWQILMNLLSNASKFTDPGGTIAVECGAEGDWITIRVTDTGRGIPPEKLESVFEPFVQADASLTRPAEGMGLGLSICRHLARDMGGDLTATSRVGVGSAFTLSLPAVRGEAASKPGSGA